MQFFEKVFNLIFRLVDLIL